MGYIYMLTSPSGNSYIGQTIGSIEKRFKQHQKPSRCVAIYNAIQLYGWENFEKEWYECPDEDLNFDEELLVREMGTLAPGGYNLREGGCNGKVSSETRQKISKSKQGKNHPMYGKTGKKCPNYGKKHSEESKKKMSESQKGEKSVWYGKHHTYESKLKISKSRLGEKHHMYGKTHTEETKIKMSKSRLGEKNHNSNRVYQYNLDGTFLQSFGSSREAARHLNKSSSPIRLCAGGDRPRAHGFKWSYTEL
jgi:hypothetical protein